MPPSPFQLKENLLKAIDNDHNVIDAKLLLEVITLLERIALTREDLEGTRLGLYINNVRKKTTDQELAKRCRKLVKSWQQLVSTVPSNHASPAPGYSPALSAAKRSPATSAYVSSSPQLLPKHRTTSPALQTVKAKTTSPASNLTVPAPERLVSPLVRQQGGKGLTNAAHLRRISPSNSRLTTPNSSSTVPNVSPKQSSSRPGTPNPHSKHSNNVGNHTQTPTSNNHSNFTPNLDVTNRTHAANKKRRRSDESNTSDGSSLKKSRNVVNGDTTRHIERIKTPRVKTTVELIAELQAQKKTRLAASDTINKIVTNQIQKEEDDINQSVVPVSARPRSHRRNNGSSGPPDPPTDLKKTKSELVHRFLQQTFEHSKDNDVDSETVDVDILGDHSTDLAIFKPTKSASPIIDKSIDPYTLLPPIDYDSIPWSDDESSEDGMILRNAITGEYPEGHEPSSTSSVGDPDEIIIDKVINDEWNGVNGTVNVNSNFHSWTETFTISHNEGEKDNVHVLPYVDI